MGDDVAEVDGDDGELGLPEDEGPDVLSGLEGDDGLDGELRAAESSGAAAR